MLLLSVFIYIYYQTLYRVKNQNKKMNNIINSTYFKLFISCIYFVLIIIFTYETTDIEAGWDGKNKNMDCPDGTYIWKIEFKASNSINEQHSGQVSLIR
jgi:hypothetical protein